MRFQIELGKLQLVWQKRDRANDDSEVVSATGKGRWPEIFSFDKSIINKKTSYNQDMIETSSWRYGYLKTIVSEFGKNDIVMWNSP